MITSSLWLRWHQRGYSGAITSINNSPPISPYGTSYCLVRCRITYDNVNDGSERLPTDCEASGRILAEWLLPILGRSDGRLQYGVTLSALLDEFSAPEHQ